MSVNNSGNLDRLSNESLEAEKLIVDSIEDGIVTIEVINDGKVDRLDQVKEEYMPDNIIDGSVVNAYKDDNGDIQVEVMVRESAERERDVRDKIEKLLGDE